MAKKAVVFDFDGTLADTAGIIRSIFAEIAIEKGWRQISDEDYEHLRKRKLWQAAMFAGVKPWQVPGLLGEGRKRFLVRAEQVKLFAGVKTVLQKLDKDGWDIYVLSSNTTEAIYEVLKHNGLEKRIQIISRPSLRSKAWALKRLMKQGYAKDAVWMVGDELRDIRGANRAGVQSIAVSWGLQDATLLAALRPTSSADRPEQIYLILSGRKLSSGEPYGKGNKKSK